VCFLSFFLCLILILIFIYLFIKFFLIFFNLEGYIISKIATYDYISLSPYISFMRQSMSRKESRWKTGSRERINTRYYVRLDEFRHSELNAKNLRAFSSLRCSWNGNATQYRERSDLYLAISWLGQIYKWGRDPLYISISAEITPSVLLECSPRRPSNGGFVCTPR